MSNIKYHINDLLLFSKEYAVSINSLISLYTSKEISFFHDRTGGFLRPEKIDGDKALEFVKQYVKNKDDKK